MRFATLLALWALLAAPIGTAVAQSSSSAANDCGVDLGCFVDQSASCGPALVNYTVDVDLAPLVGLQAGFISSTTDALSVQPDPSGSQKCQVDIAVQRTAVTLSDDAAQALLDSGKTQAQIDAVRQSMADSTSLVEGRTGTCLIVPDDLVAMLQRWQAGSFSTDDWTVATCSGTYFSWTRRTA